MVWRAMGTIILRNSGDAWVTITSGLARGIDGVAHKAALQVNGVSIAVLGNGLNTIHPRRHAPLAASLLEQGGALVSEFPSMFHPCLQFPTKKSHYQWPK